MSQTSSESFQFIDYLLLLIGCKIFRTNKFVYTLNIVVKLTYVCTLFIGVYTAAIRFSLETILINIVGMSYLISILSMLLIVTVKRLELLNLITLLNAHLVRADHVKLRRSSIVFLILSLVPITYLLSMVLYSAIQMIDGNFNSFQATLLVLIFIFFISSLFFPVTIALYVHVLYMVLLVEVNFYVLLINGNVTFTADNMLNILNERRYITHKMKNKFNQTLNILPFIWFTYFFCSFSGLIKTIGMFDRNRFAIAQAIFVSNLMAYVIAFLAFSSSVNRKLSELSDQLISRVMNSGPNRNRLLLIHELKSDCGLHLNIWDMLPLNKGFLLSFVSSLVTFSVLFIQLSKRFER